MDEPALGIWLASPCYAFAVLLIFLRHAPLALLLALAPLPGLMAAHLAGFEPLSIYAFGFCAGLLMAGVLVRPLLAGTGDWRWPAYAGAGAAAVAAPFDWQYTSLLMFSGALAMAAAALGVRYLHFGEAYIARANRAAEWRARVLEVASEIVVPRWALALSGIVLVTATLAWFRLLPHDPPDYPGFVVAAAAGFLLARNWRPALAAAWCAALLWLFHFQTILPFFALLALLLAAAAQAGGEEGAQAWRLSLEDEGAGLLFAALGGAVLLALSGKGIGGPAAFIAALIFFPALTAALWSVFPRRRSVEEMYR